MSDVGHESHKQGKDATGEGDSRQARLHSPGGVAPATTVSKKDKSRLWKRESQRSVRGRESERQVFGDGEMS